MIAAPGAVRDADARRDLQVGELARVDARDARDQLAGDPLPLRAGGARQEHDEFVPADPPEDVPRTHRLPHRLGDIGEQDVPEEVPEAVVDRLEIVDVHHEEAAGPHGRVLLEPLVDQALDDRAVVKPRHRVALGGIPQAQALPLFPVDVRRAPHRPRRAAVGAAEGDPLRPVPAVFPAARLPRPELEEDVRLPLPQVPSELLQPGEVLRVDRALRVGAVRKPGRAHLVDQHAAHAVGNDRLVLRGVILPQHPVGHLCHRLVALVFQLELLLELPFFLVVQDHALDDRHALLGAADHLSVGDPPAPAPVLLADAVVRHPGLPGPDHLPDRRFKDGFVVRVHQADEEVPRERPVLLAGIAVQAVEPVVRVEDAPVFTE